MASSEWADSICGQRDFSSPCVARLARTISETTRMASSPPLVPSTHQSQRVGRLGVGKEPQFKGLIAAALQRTLNDNPRVTVTEVQNVIEPSRIASNR